MTEEELQPPSASVDGDAVIVRNGAVLPMRCVFSNATVDRGGMQTKTLHYVPWHVYLYFPAAFLFMQLDMPIVGLVSVGIFVVMRQVQRREVTLTYGVSPAKQPSNRSLKFVIVWGVVSAVALVCAASYPDSPVALFVAIAVVFLGLLAKAAMLVGDLIWPTEAKLHITSIQKYNADHRQTEFWIKGFHPDFITQLREEGGEDNSSNLKKSWG
ncbi:MAG: hypothetical protein R3C18_17825 [Planctomycetaceae bacterium]